MSFMQTREVGEHSAWKWGSIVGLSFDVEQKEPILTTKTGFDNQINFVFFARSHISEDLFVEKFNRALIEINIHVRQEQSDKFDKKRLDQLFKYPVVVNLDILPPPYGGGFQVCRLVGSRFFASDSSPAPLRACPALLFYSF